MWQTHMVKGVGLKTENGDEIMKILEEWATLE